MTRGAPKQFDREQVLAKAMQVFWRKGYTATGLSELLEEMGIGRQSLYDTFTDKKRLFLAAVELYVRTQVGRIRDQLEAGGSPLRNVHRVLRMYELHNTSGNGLGCLLVNSLAELGAADPEFQEPLRNSLQSLEDVFRQTFERAKREGEIAASADTRALARTMCSMVCGTCLMGRVGASKAAVRDTIRMHAKLIDAVATGS